MQLLDYKQNHGKINIHKMFYKICILFFLIIAAQVSGDSFFNSIDTFAYFSNSALIISWGVSNLENKNVLYLGLEKYLNKFFINNPDGLL